MERMNQTIINSDHKSTLNYLRLVWKYLSTIHSLGKQQIKNKYANTILGVILSFIKLSLALLIYYVVFGIIIKIQIQGAHYIIFVLLGYLTWSLFITIVTDTSNSLLSAKNLYTKIYMPKICLPLSRLYIGIFEYFISIVALIVLLIYFKSPPDLKILLLPVLLFLTVFVGLSIGLWISIFSIKKRDWIHLIPYLISFGIFITPVFYPTTIIPADYTFLIYVNPLAYIIDLYRWIFTNQALPSFLYLYGFVPVIIIFCWSFYLYRKKDKIIVDYI